jgi:hypothetical protein
MPFRKTTPVGATPRLNAFARTVQKTPPEKSRRAFKTPQLQGILRKKIWHVNCVHAPRRS